jgi:D-alanyl-D-alanine carboxypeptidase
MKTFPWALWASTLLLAACAAQTPENESLASAGALSPIAPQPAAVTETIPSAPVPQTGDSITVEYLTGRFDPAKDRRFVKVRPEHGNGEAMYLRQEAYEAFVRMSDAAKKQGISLKILSATRGFDRQKLIWEEKWNGRRAVDGEFLKGPAKDPAERAQKIMRWSSMPGTSRHHWGTDIDLNDMNNSYFTQGQGKKVYEWLVANAPNFGFCQVYSAIGPQRPHGYQEEKWHWSYLPIAQVLTERYRVMIQDRDIQGFIGAEAASQIRAIERYVLGINPDCAR